MNVLKDLPYITDVQLLQTLSTNPTAIRLEDLACHKLGIRMQHGPTIVLAATAEAQTLEASELLLAELEIMLEDAMTLAS